MIVVSSKYDDSAHSEQLQENNNGATEVREMETKYLGSKNIFAGLGI